MFDYCLKTFRRWRCACWLLYHPFTNCCHSLHPSIWVHHISIRGIVGYMWHAFFPVTNTCMQAKSLTPSKARFVALVPCGWAHTMDPYRSSECSAQYFHLFSTTLHPVHFKRNVTNPAPGKIRKFQSLFEVSRQKLRQFWEAICTTALSCIYAPFMSPLHFDALSGLLSRRKHLRFCCDAGPYFPGSAV